MGGGDQREIYGNLWAENAAIGGRQGNRQVCVSVAKVVNMCGKNGEKWAIFAA